jgi:hypothetical protein
MGGYGIENRPLVCPEIDMAFVRPNCLFTKEKLPSDRKRRYFAL